MTETDVRQMAADLASCREDIALARLALNARDGETLPESAARLWKLLADEAKSRGGWATETSRLIGVVERGVRLRSEMVRGSCAAERERCARVAEDYTRERRDDDGLTPTRIAARIRSGVS